MRRPLRLTACLPVAFLIAFSASRGVSAQTTTDIYILASNSSAYKVTFEDVLVSSQTIKSPRDAASGQATGKRQHKPWMARSGETALNVGPLSQFADVPPSASNVSLSFYALINGQSGGICKVEVRGTLAPRASRLDLHLGDVARFFDDAGKPKAGVCQP